MTTKVDHPENTSVSHWLAELRMECYKKNLENFDTVKSLLEFKDPELKKLGVTNSKDRSTMLGSLANYRISREESSPVPLQATPSTESKSISRRSSLKNFNLKGLLSSSGSKKNKKSRDSMSVTVTALDLQSPDSGVSPAPAKSYPIPEYEELSNCKIGPPSSSGQKAVPNDYVPAPPEMEQFRGRSYTVGVCQPNPAEVPLRHLPENLVQRDSMNTHTTFDDDARSTRSNSSSLHQSQHLSVISMESGLSFGYDVEINPNLPLEVQPWFHGKLSRDDTVVLLNEDGDFLVRENTALANTFTLSMYWQGECDHTLIQCDEVVNSRNGTTVKYSFDGGAFDSIPELIHHHLKYQIPISKDSQNMLVTPIHRQGTRVPFAPAGYYQPTRDRGERGHSTSTGRSSPSSVRSISYDHTSHRSFSKRSSSPEVVRQYLRPYRSSSMSPGACSVSPRQSPARDVAMRGSNSSGDFLEEEEVDQVTRPRNAMSPLPAMGTSVMHSRAMTNSKLTHGAGGGGGTRDSFGDYEVMESVSLLGSPPSQRKSTSAVTPHSTNPSHAPVRTWMSGGDVKYAEIQHVRKPHDLNRRVSYSGHQHSTPPSSSVKYAEVRFQRRLQSQPNVSPHPFSVYDTVQSSPTRVNPYQSRAEVLAQKLQSEPTVRASSPATHQRLNRAESSPHSFTRHSTHSLPRQASSPLAIEGISEEMTMTTTPTLQSDAKMHSLPDRVRRRAHTISQSSLASEDLNASKVGQNVPAKVSKTFPGHELLVGLHDILSRSTEMELAYHLTRADAVAFLLTPRPGEDKEVWKERVQKTTSSSGLYVGLQTLADTDGDKLWKKLYFRHLSLSQMVALSIVCAGEPLERACILRRFIELAFILQSGAYGNLFSFIAIMQGLTFPQVLNMSQTWQLLHSAFPEATQTHKQLQDILTSLSQGVSMYTTDQLAIPAIQHLKTAFHFQEPPLPGQAPSVVDDHSLLGQHSNLLVGLDGIHSIIKHASRFSYNARKRLEPLQYNVKLMDFFSQDFVRSYLHSIGVTSEDHLERRRRFDVLLSALVDRVEVA